MDLDRRHLFALPAVAAAAVAPAAMSAAQAGPLGPAAHGIDAAQLGVVPGRRETQTLALQRAIDTAAAARLPLLLPPGTYRSGSLKLPAGAQLLGVRGATRLVLTEGPALLSAVKADAVTLGALALNGGGLALPDGRGLVEAENCAGLRVFDCEIADSAGHGLRLERVEGEVRGCTVTSAAETGLFSRDARGLTIADNRITGAGNNGIQVWRSEPGEDSTMVIGNRIEGTLARRGGSGQNGNAINVFRAHGVIVAQNRIDNAAFSAVRGNAASGLQVTGNNVTACGEVAVYAEFGFEGAVISQNVITEAALGIVVTNFNEGGRMAVVQGNIIRRLTNRRPAGTDPNDSAGIGIGVEADSAVTGNVIEDAPTAAVMLGWGRHLRDVTVTGNVLRRSGIGVMVSVAQGAGAAVIADNLIAETPGGAVVGMEWRKRVTGDLAREGAGRYAQLSVTGNRVR